jgi:hypothetical protein
MRVAEDSTVLKSTKVYLGSHHPYQYVLRHIPLVDPVTPYLACRENMKLVDGIYEVDCRYWCAYRDNQIDAEKEYNKRVETEGPKGK